MFFSWLFTDDRCLSNFLNYLLPAVFLTALFGVFRGWLWGKNNFFAVCFTEFVEQISRIVICFIYFQHLFFELNGASVASLSLTISCVISAIMIIIFFLYNWREELENLKKLYQDLLKGHQLQLTTVRIVTSLVQPLIAIIIPLRLVASGYTTFTRH